MIRVVAIMTPKAMAKFHVFMLVAAVQPVFSLMKYPDCEGRLQNNTVCDTTVSPPKRAAALVAAMTLEEKQGNFVEYVHFPEAHLHTCICARIEVFFFI